MRAKASTEKNTTAIPSAMLPPTDLRIVQGRFDDAINLLTSTEPLMQASVATLGSTQLCRTLTLSTEAHIGQDDLASAFTRLQEAEQFCGADSGTHFLQRQKYTEVNLKLYGRWNDVEPGAGHDLKFTSWTAAMRSLEREFPEMIVNAPAVKHSDSHRTLP